MVRFEVTVEFETTIRPSENISLDAVKIEPNKAGFTLKKIVESQNEILPQFEKAPFKPMQLTYSEGYRVGYWAQTLSDAIAMLSGVPVRSILKGSSQVSEPVPFGDHFIITAMAHAEMMAEPPELVLSVELLRSAIELVQEISSHQSLSLFQRAIGWYARGLADKDLVDRFIDHWVGLETLSNTYDGSVEPRKCESCGAVLNPRPIRATLRGFLKDLGFSDDDAKAAMECGEIRSTLFHSAQAVAEAKKMQPILATILRRCLFEYIKRA